RPGHASSEQPIEQAEPRGALLAAAEAEVRPLAWLPRLAEGEARALLDLANVAAAAMQHQGRPTFLEAAHDHAGLGLACTLFRIVAAALLGTAPALGPALLLLGVAAAARTFRRASQRFLARLCKTRLLRICRRRRVAAAPALGAAAVGLGFGRGRGVCLRGFLRRRRRRWSGRAQGGRR